MGIRNTLDCHVQTNRAPCFDASGPFAKIFRGRPNSSREFEASKPTSRALPSFRPALSDLVRLKTPLGQLLPGTPIETIPKWKGLVERTNPSKLPKVGDVVSRETL